MKIIWEYYLTIGLQKDKKSPPKDFSLGGPCHNLFYSIFIVL